LIAAITFESTREQRSLSNRKTVVAICSVRPSASVPRSMQPNADSFLSDADACRGLRGVAFRGRSRPRPPAWHLTLTTRISLIPQISMRAVHGGVFEWTQVAELRARIRGTRG
jgi:hypothetical protein